MIHREGESDHYSIGNQNKLTLLASVDYSTLVSILPHSDGENKIVKIAFASVTLHTVAGFRAK